MTHSDKQPLKEVTVISIFDQISISEPRKIIVVAQKDEAAIEAVASAIAKSIPLNLDYEMEKEYYRSRLTQLEGWGHFNEYVYVEPEQFIIDQGIEEYEHSEAPHPIYRGGTAYLAEDYDILGVYSVPLDDLIPDVCYPITIY